MEEHVFCSDACMDEWRRDVYGDDEVENPTEGENDSAGETAPDAGPEEKEPAAGGEG